MCASRTTNLDIYSYANFIHCGVIFFFVVTFFCVKQLTLGRIIFFTCFFFLLKSAWTGGRAPPNGGVKIFFLSRHIAYQRSLPESQLRVKVDA